MRNVPFVVLLIMALVYCFNSYEAGAKHMAPEVADKHMAAPLPVSDPVPDCQMESRETFERHLFSAKFQENGSCSIFYKDNDQHIACWTTTPNPVGIRMVSVTCH